MQYESEVATAICVTSDISPYKHGALDVIIGHVERLDRVRQRIARVMR